LGLSIAIFRLPSIRVAFIDDLYTLWVAELSNSL